MVEQSAKWKYNDYIAEGCVECHGLAPDFGT